MDTRLAWSSATLLVLFVGCTPLGTTAGGQTPASRPVARTGVWGGSQAMLTVADNEPATLELPCAHGTISGPLTVGADGTVDWSGQFVQEQGGTVPTGEAGGARLEVRYRGTLAGDTLTLEARAGDRQIYAPVTVTYGQPARLGKCR